jgi:hypothetical protein
MGFSAIIPAAEVAAANSILENAGYGEDNFSVPLMSGEWKDGNAYDAYGMNVGGDEPDFRNAVAAIPNVDVRDAETGEVTFDEHAADLGLVREPPQEVEESAGLS